VGGLWIADDHAHEGEIGRVLETDAEHLDGVVIHQAHEIEERADSIMEEDGELADG
jgi:hypothetical protein